MQNTYQYSLVILVIAMCSGSCSTIRPHFSRQESKTEISIKEDISPPIASQKIAGKGDSLRHWFVPISKDRPIRIRNRHSIWRNSEQNYRIVPVVSISNMPPDHSPMAIQDDPPTRSGGFGIAGFVMSFFAWIFPIGIIAIVFSAIGLGRGRPYKGLALAGLIIAIVGLLIGLAALSM